MAESEQPANLLELIFEVEKGIQSRLTCNELLGALSCNHAPSQPSVLSIYG